MRPTAAILVALLAVAVATQAQAPPSGAAGVAVVIEGPQQRPSIDEPGFFHAKVTNTGASSPFDAQNQADVDVKVTAPAGWTAVADPSHFKLAPGASQDVTVTVSVSGGAVEAADITVTADLVSPLQSLDPILGPGGQPQRASASAVVRMTSDDSVTRNVLEAVGPWIYAILLLLVAAVLVAVAISLASRRTLVRLSSDTRELTLPPGGRVAFPFKVEGLAKVDDAVLLQVSAVQEGWAAFLPVPEVLLTPGQVQEMTLVVISPRTATDGARQAVLVSATSAKAPKGAANLEFVATVRSGTALLAERRPKG